VIGRTGPCVAKSVVEEFLTERGSVYHQNVHTLILDTTNVMVMITKRRNVTSSVVQVCYPKQYIQIIKLMCLIQKNHTGEYGRTGLCVAKSVEEEFLTERENVFHLSVHILTLDTINVMVMIMKKRNVMNSVVQVCKR